MEPYDPAADASTIRITQLGLSVRAANSLYNNKVFTLENLFELDDADLRELRGLGKNSYEEILEKIDSFPKELVKSYRHASTVIPSEEALDTEIKNIGYSARTTNALINNGITTIGDLYYTPQSEVRDLPGMGLVGFDELYKNGAMDQLIERLNNTDRSVKLTEFHEFCLRTLKERALLILDRYYGLSGAAGTLQQVGDEFQITRERARQIIKSSLKKIKAGVDTNVINPFVTKTLFEMAKTGTPIDAIPEISPVYAKRAIAAIYADVFPEKLKIYKSIALKSHWLVSKAEKMDEDISRTLEILRLQSAPVRINELASHCNVDEALIYDLDKVTIGDDLIVLNTNRRALGNDRMYEIQELLDKTVRPMTVTEIMEILGLPERVVRSTMGRTPGIVNVGLSTYALEKYGYTKKTSDIIYDFLSEEGEPVHVDRIIDYIKKYRTVSDGAIYGALSVDSDIFTRLEEGYVALTQWGFEPRELKSKRLEIPALFATKEVLEANDTPLSQHDILKEIEARYGDKSTQSLVTVASVLKKLVQDNVVTRLGTQRSPYYLMKR